MDLALQTNGNMFDKVTVTLTRRDVVLMDLCLKVMAYIHASSNLRSDIEGLQTRMAGYHPRREAAPEVAAMRRSRRKTGQTKLIA